MLSDFLPVLAQWPLLLQGLLLTVLLTAISTPLGVAIGIAGGWLRVHGNTPARVATSIYLELTRNTPFIIQLFFIFFGLPALGVKLSTEAACVLALSLNLGAYCTEIVRAGIQATPRGHIEAAQSLALNRWQVFAHVVLPPALKRVWPALVGQIILVMLGSAVCSQISMEELTYSANLISSRTFRNFEAYILIAAIYLLLAILLRQGLNWLGPRWIFGR
ncbi:polar amino acid ABC transporter permease [Bordetella sp. J329]|jgi:polar amino acid transport system permease protein|uniref:amino acid ABC transporter permease n=1 Tax=Kerstersia gyiorum TaxID=206506 RepID=UPI000FD74892|nr:amino acid ABC transporter permease [Kerstersia gyiorum]AZV95376.1 polar amino acid ABC transporter permease [Bordetella sp. J329]MCH4271297.1 amino acid ABC transporter permease [Kerstersia gyiorum]MCI1227929.1 amino acid ABC transporter permease [Kerstersia gyiorum]QBR39912.1 amino acid ABC transporter permease [Kerstersia gyiorum]